MAQPCNHRKLETVHHTKASPREPNCCGMTLRAALVLLPTRSARHTLRVQGDRLAAELVELLHAHHVAHSDHEGGEGPLGARVACPDHQLLPACSSVVVGTGVGGGLWDEAGAHPCRIHAFPLALLPQRRDLCGQCASTANPPVCCLALLRCASTGVAAAKLELLELRLAAFSATGLRQVRRVEDAQTGAMAAGMLTCGPYAQLVPERNGKPESGGCFEWDAEGRVSNCCVVVGSTLGSSPAPAAGAGVGDNQLHPVIPCQWRRAARAAWTVMPGLPGTTWAMPSTAALSCHLELPLAVLVVYNSLGSGSSLPCSRIALPACLFALKRVVYN